MEKETDKQATSSASSSEESQKTPAKDIKGIYYNGPESTLFKNLKADSFEELCKNSCLQTFEVVPPKWTKDLYKAFPLHKRIDKITIHPVTDVLRKTLPFLSSLWDNEMLPVRSSVDARESLLNATDEMDPLLSDIIDRIMLYPTPVYLPLWMTVLIRQNSTVEEKKKNTIYTPGMATCALNVLFHYSKIVASIRVNEIKEEMNKPKADQEETKKESPKKAKISDLFNIVRSSILEEYKEMVTKVTIIILNRSSAIADSMNALHKYNIVLQENPENKQTAFNEAKDDLNKAFGETLMSGLKELINVLNSYTYTVIRLYENMFKEYFGVPDELNNILVTQPFCPSAGEYTLVESGIMEAYARQYLQKILHGSTMEVDLYFLKDNFDVNELSAEEAVAFHEQMVYNLMGSFVGYLIFNPLLLNSVDSVVEMSQKVYINFPTSHLVENEKKYENQPGFVYLSGMSDDVKRRISPKFKESEEKEPDDKNK